MTLILTIPEREELDFFHRAARPPACRTLHRFAEDEIVLPDGPWAGFPFRCDRQPWTALYFDAMDSGKFNRSFCTGPVQSGKSLTFFVIPMLYYLFEMAWTSVMGVPKLDTSNDKWVVSLKPVIDRTRYRDLLPTDGEGARGGNFNALRFQNGATLRIMSGGGGSDASAPASFTARVVMMTEVDKMDRRSEASRMADPVTELENRAQSFGRRKRIHGECTLTTEQGRSYREITAGTDSKIVLHCPACGAWVRPEREHLIGYQNARCDDEAEENGRFVCPSCAAAWSEEQRVDANRECRLVHRGQEVSMDGLIVGDGPRTRTLGFRFGAVNNLLMTSGEIAREVYRAMNANDEDTAERQLCQNVFAVPYKPAITETTPLSVDMIMRRTAQLGRGIVPPGTKVITAAIDLGKHVCHWIATAWSENASGRVIAYGRIETPIEFGEERGVQSALDQFETICVEGWREGERIWHPMESWIDSSWGATTPAVYAWVKRKHTLAFRAIKGFGSTQGIAMGKVYIKPKDVGQSVPLIGEHYHFSVIMPEAIQIVLIDADFWKSSLHRALVIDPDKPGALILHADEDRAHFRLAKHLTAERQIEEYEQGVGVIKRWIRQSQDNHWFDTGYMAMAAGHFCGVRRIEENNAQATVASQRPRIKPGLAIIGPRGEPFRIGER